MSDQRLTETMTGLNKGPEKADKGKVHYLRARAETATATWCSFGRQGACIQLSRHVPPGRHLILSDKGRECCARVVWCRPTASGNGFVAGVRIFRDDPLPESMIIGHGPTVFCEPVSA